MAQMNLDTSGLQDTAGGSPLAKGKYIMMITESDIKQTKAGDGTLLAITLEVCDQGVNQSRKAWHNMTYVCPKSEIAQNIALSHMKRIGEATGVPSIQDTVQWHNIPMVVTLGLEKDDPNRNCVTGAAFERWDGVAIPAPVAAPSAAAVPVAPVAPTAPVAVAPVAPSLAGAIVAPVAPVAPAAPAAAPPYAAPPALVGAVPPPPPPPPPAPVA